MAREELDPKYWIIKSIYTLTVVLIFFPPLMWLGSYLQDESQVQCSLHDLYLTALQNNIATNATNATTATQSVIYFDLILQNKAAQMGVYYKNITLTFSYVNNTTIVLLGNYTIPGFHQGIGKDTRRKDFFLVPGGAPWGEGATTAVVRVDLTTAVRLKLKLMMSRRYKLLAQANVTVNGTTGKKVGDKSIVLKHTYNHHISGWAVFGFVVVALCQIFFGLICLCCVACCTSF